MPIPGASPWPSPYVCSDKGRNLANNVAAWELCNKETTSQDYTPEGKERLNKLLSFNPLSRVFARCGHQETGASEGWGSAVSKKFGRRRG